MKKSILIALLFSLVFLMSGIAELGRGDSPTSNTSNTVEVTLLGPKQYIRTTGKPNIYADTFPGRFGQGKLIVKNGDANGDNRISSAIIKINGIQILGTNDFNQNVYALETIINLVEKNTISVELRSKPGSYLAIQIKQEIHAQGANVIGPAGGTVDVLDTSSPYYGVRMEIPFGALNEPELISINEPSYNPPIPTNYVPGSNPIEFLPSGLEFNYPAKLVIPSFGFSERNYYVYDDVDEKWRLLDTIYNNLQDVFLINIFHFSFVNTLCRKGNFSDNCQSFPLDSDVYYSVDSNIVYHWPSYTDDQIYEIIKSALGKWASALDGRINFIKKEKQSDPEDIKFYWSNSKREFSEYFGPIRTKYHSEAVGSTSIDKDGIIHIAFKDTGEYIWTVDDSMHDPDKKMVSIGSIALHESGHAMGLDHYCIDKDCTACEASNPRMARWTGYDVCNVLKDYDIEKIRKIYGIKEITVFFCNFDDGTLQGWGTKDYSCLSSERAYSGNYSIKVNDIMAGGNEAEVYRIFQPAVSKGRAELMMFIPSGNSAGISIFLSDKTYWEKYPSTRFQIYFETNGQVYWNQGGWHQYSNRPIAFDTWNKVILSWDCATNKMTLNINGYDYGIAYNNNAGGSISQLAFQGMCWICTGIYAWFDDIRVVKY